MDYIKEIKFPIQMTEENEKDFTEATKLLFMWATI